VEQEFMERPFVKTAGNHPGKPESLSNRIFHASAYVCRRALDALWAPSCFLCGARAGAVLCADCSLDLPRVGSRLCACCALPVPAEGLLCGGCQRRPPAFDASRAVWQYAHPVREMVLAFKHGQGFGLAGLFAGMLAQEARLLDADCILPVPLHPARMRERGFNPACELSRPLARQLGLEHLPQVLLRDRHTPRLAGLRGRERAQAVRGAFRCEADLSGRRVIVVDDVMTSGATLQEIARTLRQRGAVRVSNLVLARTLKHAARD
jgi:ComF family protein